MRSEGGAQHEKEGSKASKMRISTTAIKKGVYPSTKVQGRKYHQFFDVLTGGEFALQTDNGTDINLPDLAQVKMDIEVKPSNFQGRQTLIFSGVGSIVKV